MAAYRRLTQRERASADPALAYLTVVPVSIRRGAGGRGVRPGGGGRTPDYDGRD